VNKCFWLLASIWCLAGCEDATGPTVDMRPVGAELPPIPMPVISTDKSEASKSK
jgi:hypothetical protein